MRPPVRTYVDWARRAPSTGWLVLVVVVAGSIFLVGLPLLLVGVAARIDEAVGLPSFSAGAATTVPGMLL
ncbi:MAG TPA: hypothetical protein VFK68_01455, partial [Propionibacteriaceae bacterium]|nr:hypothetical protein [Propionibacteriaceae bacterium]